MTQNITRKLYSRYWGKALPQLTEEGEEYHLLAYHSLDVAAVGESLLLKNPALCRRLAKLMQLSEEDCLKWCVFLLGIHDLGKFAESFQQLHGDLRTHFFPEKPIKFQNYSVRHDSLGELIWKDHIRKALLNTLDANEDLEDFIKDDFKLWIAPMVGHHGQPPNSNSVRVREHFVDHDQEAALSFFEDWQEFMSVDFRQLYAQQDPNQSILSKNQVSWLLAGVAVLCDWIGSDQTIFTYHTEKQGLSLKDYWEQVALPAANGAVINAGILPSQTTKDLQLEQLFSYIQKPTPLQAQCTELKFNEEPQLFILEDVTGAGKTEAALMLAHRLISKNMAEGFYVGLPTMATANAMYERMAETYKKFYQKGETPSLILSHGARHLSNAFRQSLLASEHIDKYYDVTDETVTAQCNRWLADNRKKALLADVGVGTIDQALLGVLPAKHQSLRLFGLASKVLILDEIHAYDAYTGELLKTLIKFHAALGGSVILLSATLTKKQRETLGRAFGDKSFSSQRADIYPLLTTISVGTPAKEIPLETRAAVKREVAVAFLHKENAVIAAIHDAVMQGKSVCWIRNTVSDARDAWTELQEQKITNNDKLHLFHSRYTLKDRLDTEEEVLGYFGKKSTPSQRNGRVLVATQVVEQSLDLDFDVMISDLAPIDLLIQRAGRLQRHNRNDQGEKLPDGEPDQRGIPTLIIHSPEFSDAPQDDWFKKTFPKADFVYQHTLVLWRTMKILQSQGGWFMPADPEGKRGARDMLEFVYDDDESDIPSGLENRTAKAIGEAMSKVDAGDFASLRPELGYTNNAYWDEEARHMTRLGEESHTVYLARWENDKLTPWINEGIYCWDLSSTRVNYQQLAGLAPVKDDQLKKKLTTLKEEEKMFDAKSFVLPLSDSGGIWQGSGRDGEDRNVEILYSSQLGLEIIRQSKLHK